MLCSSCRYLHEVLQARKCFIFLLSTVSSDSSSESREILSDLIDVTETRAHEKEHATPLYFHRQIYLLIESPSAWELHGLTHQHLTVNN